MEFRHVRTFVTVVDQRGFASAAHALYCSQPTISSHVAELERELGTPLFARDRRPVELTQAGEAFLGHARTLLREIEAAHHTVSGIVGLTRGTVRLGTYPSATVGFVPGVVQAFTAAHPGIQVSLVESGGAQLPDMALDHEVDLFLRQTVPPLDDSAFACDVLWREDFMVVAHPDHPLAREETAVPADRLLEHALVVTGQFDPDSLMAHPFWASLPRRPSFAFQVAQPQSLLALVAANMGVGVTTELALRVSRAEGLVIRRVASPLAVREVALYSPRRRSPSPAAAALTAFIRDPGRLPPGCRAPATDPRPATPAAGPGSAVTV